MSNLSFIWKLLGKVVYFQFLLCFEANNLLLFTPFGFFFAVLRPHLKIYNDFLLSCDKGNISLFLCLDFSSAFDTVDHFSLIQQLENFFGISGFCLKWISSNISNWSFVVSINNSHSTPSSFPFGVSQGFFSWSFFLFLILLNFQKLFHHLLFRVNFRLITRASSFHFLSVNYLQLYRKKVVLVN